MTKTYTTPDGITLHKVVDRLDGVYWIDNGCYTNESDIVQPVGVCFYCELSTAPSDRPSCDTCEADITADIAQSTVSNFIGEGTS